MVRNNKELAHSLVLKAKEKNLITTYKVFCKSKLAEETKITDDEIACYTSNKREEKK